MVSFNFELGIIQYSIIGIGLASLVIFLIISRNYKKKKEAEEEALENMGSEEIGAPTEETSTNSGEVSPEEKPIKDYIDQYKTQFDRDAIKSALVNAGNDAALVDSCLDKYL